MVLDSSPTGALVGKPLERPTTEYSAGDTFQPVVWVQTAQHECLEGVLFFCSRGLVGPQNNDV